MLETAAGEGGIDMMPRVAGCKLQVAGTHHKTKDGTRFSHAACYLLFATCIFLVFSQGAHARSKTFPVEVKVDFGTTAKKGVERTLYVEKGTTPKEAVSQIFPVLSGMACCSPRDLISIDGVAVDPAKNRWWICKLNGSKKFSPHKKKLKPGDRIEWQYVEDEQ